jgi:hypothetical protein
MNLISSFVNDNRGVAIVAVTMVMVVIALLGGAIITQTTHDTQLSNRAHSDKQALYIAESAKERTYQEIINDVNFTTLVNQGFLFNQPLQGGTYDLTATTLQEVPTKVVQISVTGTASRGDVKQIDVVAEVIQENVSVWNNAIFGGSGQTGGVINGNAAIHGSVHLLGDDVSAGNNSIAALDLIGESLIHNNYAGIPAELLAKLPALPTAEFGGETIATIDAKLRVKNGAVGVSGASEIGEADIFGNGSKETMNGIYIETDAAATRWTGNQVDGDGNPNPDSVQSDNGFDALYDLGDAVQMPDLDEPYEAYPSYEAYFSDNALHVPAMSLVDSTDAAQEIFNHNAAGNFPPGTVVNVDLATGAFQVQNGDNTIAYNPQYANGEALLVVHGMIQVEGSLEIGKHNFDVTYADRGTIYVSNNGGSGDIDIHSNLMPLGQFPTGDVIGLMARDDINLATGPGDSLLMMAGAFYAADEIVSAKQNEIAGTFVSTYFNMGTNVPKIYQAPSLADNLPPGLIASEPIMVVTGFVERSWQAKTLTPVANYYPYGQYPYGDYPYGETPSN